MGQHAGNELRAASGDRSRGRVDPRHGFSDELNEAIQFGEFPTVLRLAIAHRGLSLARLQAHLQQRGIRIGQSTLSYWQRGVRTPSLPDALTTVRTLELVLQLPEGALVELINRRQIRRQQRAREVTFYELTRTAMAGKADLLMAELSIEPGAGRANSRLEHRAVHEAVAFGAHGQMLRVKTRIVLRAQHSGVDRYVALYHGDVGCDVERVGVVAVEGCRVGRVRRYEGPAGIVIELIFDRKLNAGETHTLYFEVEDGTGAPSPGFYRMLRERCQSHLLQLRFDPAMLPARCTREFRFRSESAPLESEELLCDNTNIASGYFSDIGPGVAAVTLEWP